MVKKLIISLVLTLAVLAFPIRFLGLSENLEAVAKIFKGLAFIMILLYLMYREGFLKQQKILRGISIKTFIKLLPVILLIAGYVAYFRHTDLKNYKGTIPFLLLTLSGTLVAASAEEVIFRGYIFNLFKKYKYSLLKSLIFSAGLFSLVHLANSFRFEDGWAIINQLIMAFAFGMLFGSIYALTRNLLLVCILHFLVNIPTSVKKITKDFITEPSFANPTFFEELMSTLFVLILTLPVILLAFYYLKKAERNDNSIRTTGLTMAK